MSDDDPTAKLPPDDSDDQQLDLGSTLETMQSRLSEFEQQVAALDQKLDKRLHDTRPIWEGVLAEVRE